MGYELTTLNRLFNHAGAKFDVSIGEADNEARRQVIIHHIQGFELQKPIKFSIKQHPHRYEPSKFGLVMNPNDNQDNNKALEILEALFKEGAFQSS